MKPLQEEIDGLKKARDEYEAAFIRLLKINITDKRWLALPPNQHYYHCKLCHGTIDTQIEPTEPHDIRECFKNLADRVNDLESRLDAHNL